jgi:hypothetical protein
MRNKEKLCILIFLVLLFALFYSGCVSIIPDSTSNPELLFSPPNIGPTSGWIVIENGSETTKDSSPLLTIYSEGAVYMSFSGDGENWTEWVNYDNSYQEFNIANGLIGTIFGSGTKYVYIRFKDEVGNLSLTDEIAFDTIEYEMGELYSIKIFPQEVTIPVEGSHFFTLHGYDLRLNEVPLDSAKVTWTKLCGVGSLFPITGLSTTYTAPSIPGKRNITAQYNNLKTGAIVIVVEDE